MDKITEKDFEVLNQPEADTPLDFATVKLREHQTAVVGMLALMKTTPYTHTDGTKTTLYDALEKYILHRN